MTPMSQGKMRCHKGTETTVMYRFTEEAPAPAVNYGTIVGNLAHVDPEVFARHLTLVCDDATEFNIVVSEFGARYANFVTTSA